MLLRTQTENVDAKLLTIPVELREMILIELFSSTVVYYGFGTKKKTNTSILRTCRVIYLEAKFIMHSNISLHLKNKVLLKYWVARAHRRSFECIKRIHLHSYKQFLFRERDDVSTALNTLHALQQNGLAAKHFNLDFFLVRRNGTDFLPNILPLINSDGWMELLMTVSVKVFRESNNCYDHYEHFQSQNQPAFWNEMLLVRDGRDSGAEVKMYLEDESFETSSRELASTNEHDEKRLLIVARRGRGIRDFQVGQLTVTWMPVPELY